MGNRAFVPHIITSDSALGGSVIEHSLRFNKASSHYLNRTPSSAGNRDTYTIALWIKRGRTGNNHAMFYAGTSVGSNHNNVDAFLFNTADRLEFFGEIGQSVQYNVTTNRRFRDVSAWYHIVLAVDTTQGTASNRIKMYVNGVQETSFSSSNYMSQNQDRFVNATNLHTIGYPGADRTLDGYMAEYHFIDGQALDPSYFGYTDFQTGMWRPKKVTGITYGTNGFHLEFKDNTNNAAMGKDTSGRGNNWTVNGLSSSHDHTTDTPLNNFCGLNFLNSKTVTAFSEGNLKCTLGNSDSRTIMGTLGVKSGKWYYEVYYNSAHSDALVIGFANAEYSPTSRSGNSTGSHNQTDHVGYYGAGDGFLYYGNNNRTTLSGQDFTAGDIIGVAADFDSNKFYAYKNGSVISSANPYVYTFVDKVYVPSISNATSGGSQEFTANFGQDSTFAGATSEGGYKDANGQGDFKYPVPSGFLALCSNNLPSDAPTSSIIRPQKHFDTLIWDGTNSASRDITGLQFEPDLVWIKNRTQGNTHSWQDSMIGFGDDKTLRTDTNGALDTNGNLYGYINHTISNGINVNSGSDHGSSRVSSSASGAKHVAWCWKAGGSSNTFNVDGTGYASASAAGITNGTIALTHASVNREAGFSILRYTGGGSAGTIGHGLGKVPKWIITKRISATEDWKVYHPDLTGGHFLKLNEQQQSTSNTDVYPDTDPTTTVYSVGSHDSVSGNSSTYVAYCWAEIPGYSKFGMYLGNNNADGTFIYTGFRPAWIVIKNRDAGGYDWVLQDNKRSPHNLCEQKLNPNDNNTEQTDYDKLDMLSDGFKIRKADAGSNASGSEYVYMAFAEQPTATAYKTEPNAR